MNQGPAAEYEAQRKSLYEQIELQKIELENLAQKKQMLMDMEKLQGGQADKILDVEAAQVRANAQLIKFQKTLQNIASPSLMEQVLGAPQRVLAMLPTSQQLFQRAKNTVASQLKGMQGLENQAGKSGFTTYILPAIGASNLFGGMGGGMNRFLGSRFMPTHVPMGNMPGLDVRGTFNRGVASHNGLGDAALQVGQRADAAVQSQINVNPYVNINVQSIEKDWDTKIAPKVKDIVMNTYRQLENAGRKGLNR